VKPTVADQPPGYLSRPTAHGVETFNLTESEQVCMAQTEMECYPTVRDRGQVTIPEDVREPLGIEPGDRIKLTVERLD